MRYWGFRNGYVGRGALPIADDAASLTNAQHQPYKRRLGITRCRRDVAESHRTHYLTAFTPCATTARNFATAGKVGRSSRGSILWEFRFSRARALSRNTSAGGRWAICEPARPCIRGPPSTVAANQFRYRIRHPAIGLPIGALLILKVFTIPNNCIARSRLCAGIQTVAYEGRMGPNVKNCAKCAIIVYKT